MQRRVWIRSGIVEELDAKQERLLALVLSKINYHYRQTGESRNRYPLSLSRLMRLCRRNGPAVSSALRVLANTIAEGTQGLPPIYYDRIKSERNACHRPYRIFLRHSHRTVISADVADKRLPI